MKNLVLILALLIWNSISAQTKVKLRDLTFSVPSQFHYFAEQGRKLDLDFYNETGKIFTDSVDLEKFPKIQYQYYENPDSGLKSAEEVLRHLNEIVTKDIPADSLLINGSENYSLAKYSIMGKSLFEVKSLGKRGWLNLQYFDFPENDNENFRNITTIINSINHSGTYESDYDQHLKESGESSKWALIFLGISLLIYIIRKIIKKKVA
ncbi:hypothetical protein [Aquimarina litoralis]|uniref:hypothetical protein n=1 Tax=Aquimarina litoralis TaxID=584605 RepID=UPI001C564299|nr:hypothetical protein [Aquimarina litoralis]MBW1297928.1 hypothetical protein [Aquimarina litoralis]